MITKANCFRAGIWLLRKLQRYVGASTVGVRAIIIDQQRKVLLVKHTYMPGWHLPGGGVHAGETVVDAIIREVKEEAGIIVKDTPQLFGVYFHQVQGVNDYPILFVITDFTHASVNCAEIEEIGWFDMEELPKDTSQSTCYRLEEFFLNQRRKMFW